MHDADDPCLLDIAALHGAYRSRRLMPSDVIEASIRRIEALDKTLNAICTPDFNAARAVAREADAALARGDVLPPLFGVPVTIKDLTDTRGLRTTFGSLLYADRVPEEDAIIVARLREAGAIILGKSNTPEFGAGGNTTNALFGATRNPWNPSLTSGGSTGGGAVAVATGMCTIAEGTDLGGSLRTPAAFNGIVGFRTSPGLIPFWPSDDAFDTLWVTGPMGRTVGDVARAVAAVAGPDARAPLSWKADTAAILAAATTPSADGLRIAYAEALGGLVPVDRRIRAACRIAAEQFAALGAVVEEASPPLDGIVDVIMGSRALAMVASHAERVAEHRTRMNPNLVWNVEQGMAMTAAAVSRAARLRSRLWHATRSFFDQYDLLITPTVSVLPFPVEESYPTAVDGVALTDYTRWFHLTYVFTVLGLPAMSVPCGYTAEGLPVGLQVVGRWRDDAGVVRAAGAFERATIAQRRLPPVLAHASA